MQKPKLEFVSTIQDIKKNIKTFNERAKDNLGTIKKDYLKKQRRYWVYDPDTYQFGPGKFVAYKEMTFKLCGKILCYRRKCQSKQYDGVYFDGGVAWQHIQNEVATPEQFNEPDDSLINKFENWANQLCINLTDRLGTNLNQVIRYNYRFLKL